MQKEMKIYVVVNGVEPVRAFYNKEKAVEFMKKINAFYVYPIELELLQNMEEL